LPWRQARSELESFLKEQPENYILIGDLALTNMGLGDKAAALALAERAIAANPIEKDAMEGPASSRIELQFAEMKDPVKDKLKRFGLLDQIGTDAFHPTIDAAVDAYLAEHAVDWKP
jgi:hypothetical protein